MFVIDRELIFKNQVIIKTINSMNLLFFQILSSNEIQSKISLQQSHQPNINYSIMRNKINSQQILVIESHINRIKKHKSLNKYLTNHSISKRLKTQLKDPLKITNQKEISHHINVLDFQTAEKSYRSQLVNSNFISNQPLNLNNLATRPIKKNQNFQKKSNLRLLWEKTQKRAIKKLFNDKLQQMKSLDIKSNVQSNQFQPNYIKFINRVDITLNDEQQNLIKSRKNPQTIHLNDFNSELSPYTTFGKVLIPKTQLKISKWSTKRNKLFQDKQIFNPERQITIKNALQKMRLKYSTLSQIEFNQIVSINSIRQNQHPGPKLKRQRKQILLSISQTIKKNSNLQKTNKNPLKINSIKKNDIEANCLDLDNDKVYKRKIISFLEFVIKVNYSNKIYKEIKLSDKYQNIKRHKVYVGPGNNKFLIVGLLKRRFWLQIVDKISPQVQFFWTQNSLNQIHKKQSSLQKNMINSRIERNPLNLQQKFQFQTQQAKKKPALQYETISSITLTNLKHSESLSNNIQGMCKSKNKQIQFRLKTYSNKRPKIRIQQLNPTANQKLFLNKKTKEKIQAVCESKILRIMNAQGKKKNQEIQLQTSSFFSQSKTLMTNHIPNNSFIGSKKALFYTMEFYYTHIKNINPFEILPKTYHIHSNQQSYNHFIAEEKNKSNSIWIVKPGQCTNRGNGIFLIKYSEISNNLLKKEYHKSGQEKTMIIQHYIKNPLLYYGRKFDIRHYMMVTVVNGNLKAYWYEQGYVRTCSQLFTLSNLENIFIHLTNDAVQKNSQNYGKYQPGNKVSYSQFQRYLQNQIINPSANSNLSKSVKKLRIDFKQNILKKMKQIAIDVIKANYLNLDKERKYNNFQIFGMDFMIDAKFNVWLIQINSNPCLELSCPLLSRIIPNMIENTLRLGLDPLIMPQTHYPPNKRYYISDNILQNLKYEIIFDQLQENLSDKRQLMEKSKQFLRQKGQLILKQSLQSSSDFYQNQGKEVQLNQIYHQDEHQKQKQPSFNF